MLRKNPSGHLPVIDESAYVDQTAIICGKVIIQANVFIGPYAVIRADETNENGEMEPIVIGANSNIQDGVVIHSKAGAAVIIGESSQTDLALYPPIDISISEFSESVVTTNIELVKGYKALHNEF